MVGVGEQRLLNVAVGAIEVAGHQAGAREQTVDLAVHPAG
jgi:hypothetical protein